MSAGKLPFEQIKAAALAQIERLLGELFPAGRQRGREFMIGDLRGTPGDSLSINIDTGRWADFAVSDLKGDFLGLWAACRHGGDRVAAARDLATKLGVVENGHDRHPPSQQVRNKKPDAWEPIAPVPRDAPRPTAAQLQCDMLHEYYDANDQLLGYVLRFEARNGKRKEFVPLSFGKLDGRIGWHNKALLAPKPLYRLNALGHAAPDAVVLLCEGEKKTEAAQRMFPEYVALSWMGGAGADGKADLAPLDDRSVIVWPDADRGGREAAVRLAKRLNGARIVNTDGLPEKFDAANLELEIGEDDDPLEWLNSRLPQGDDPPPDDAFSNGEFEADHTAPEPGAGHAEGPPPPLRFHIVNPADLETVIVPSRTWIVDDWLPVASVTCNYGDGGTGKTLLAQQLQTATSAPVPWCGLPVRPCKSFGLYCEDDEDELHRRQDAINGAFNVAYSTLSDMRWISGVGDDWTLVNFTTNGRMCTTKRWDLLVREVKAFGAKLVPLDTAADLFGGNENDRSQVRRFMSLLAGLGCDIGGAVILNCHPSRTGLQSGNLDGASTAWSNTSRSRWSLARPDGADVPMDTPERILTRRKANYARIGETIRLRWAGGALAPIGSDGGATGIFNRAKVEAVFLEQLDKCEAAGQRMSDSKQAGNYAPKVFARRPDAQGFAAKDFERAMAALFASAQIAMQSYGRTGDARQKIIRTGRGTE